MQMSKLKQICSYLIKNFTIFSTFLIHLYMESQVALISSKKEFYFIFFILDWSKCRLWRILGQTGYVGSCWMGSKAAAIRWSDSSGYFLACSDYLHCFPLISVHRICWVPIRFMKPETVWSDRSDLFLSDMFLEHPMSGKRQDILC